MRNMDDLYAFAEDLIELALIGGDEDTAGIIEDALDLSQLSDSVEEQLGEMLLGLVMVEDRINVPDYPIESVILLRTTLRGMHNGAGKGRYIH